MNTWAKTGRTVGPEGTAIIYTDLRETGLTIESRKRHIPHANGRGTFDITTYWVLRDGEDLKQRYTLRDAKEWAEKYAIERGLVHGPEE